MAIWKHIRVVWPVTRCIPALLFLLLLGSARCALAQDVPVRTDSTVREALPFGEARSYSQLLREYRQLKFVPARPMTPADSAQDGVIRLEIDALVVDETQTKLGRDFYEVFFTNWKSPAGAFNYSVRVQEQPTPGLGTRIIVKVNEEIAFQAQLQPRYDIIEVTARQAIAYTQYLLLNRAPTDLAY